MTRELIFVSSVQKELADERRALAAFVLGHPLLQRFFDAFLFGLPEPDFEQRGGQFVVTLWRDWLSDAILVGLGLSERQQDAVKYLRVSGRLRNTDYQTHFDVSKATASRDLEGLVARGVLRKVGTRGKGTHYVLDPNGLTKGSMGSSRRPNGNRGSNRAGVLPRPGAGKEWLIEGSSGSSRRAGPGATKGPKGPSRHAPRRPQRGVSPVAETRQKPAKPDTPSVPGGARRPTRPEPRLRGLTKDSMGSPSKGRRKRDKNGTNET